MPVSVSSSPLLVLVMVMAPLVLQSGVGCARTNRTATTTISAAAATATATAAADARHTRPASGLPAPTRPPGPEDSRRHSTPEDERYYTSRYTSNPWLNGRGTAHTSSGSETAQKQSSSQTTTTMPSQQLEVNVTDAVRQTEKPGSIPGEKQSPETTSAPPPKRPFLDTLRALLSLLRRKGPRSRIFVPVLL